MSALVQRFERNPAGRDFVVGDVHGCFDLMRALLADVAFDESKDRLFSVGDLVDRGPQSAEAVEWIMKPWFFAVRGNHEQMAIEVANGQVEDEDAYRRNGGSWFLALPTRERKAIARVLAELPLVIEIDAPLGKVGIVHADPVFFDWPQLLSKLDDEHVQLAATWSRQKYQYDNTNNIAGIDFVIVGHTIVEAPTLLGNVLYIDTGPCKLGRLTIMELSDPPALTQHQARIRSAA